MMNYSHLIGAVCFSILSTSAQAALFSFEYNDTVNSTNIDGLSFGDAVKITVSLDNGGVTNESQVWSVNNLQSVTFDFNNGGVVTTFSNPWGSDGLATDNGEFETDATGQPIFVMSDWSDTNVSSNFVTTASSADTFDWGLSINSPVYIQYISGADYYVNLSSPEEITHASSWSAVSAVPVPPAAFLFGSGLLGLIGTARRKKAA